MANRPVKTFNPLAFAGKPPSKLDAQKTLGTIPKSGMQVLGRVGQMRRAAPKPVTLPSMRAENSGLDPTVAIVPLGSTGWGSGAAKKPLGVAEEEPEVEAPPPEVESSSKASPPKTWAKPVELSAGRHSTDLQFPTLGTEGVKEAEQPWRPGFKSMGADVRSGYRPSTSRASGPTSVRPRTLRPEELDMPTQFGASSWANAKDEMDFSDPVIFGDEDKVQAKVTRPVPTDDREDKAWTPSTASLSWADEEVPQSSSDYPSPGRDQRTGGSAPGAYRDQRGQAPSYQQQQPQYRQQPLQQPPPQQQQPQAQQRRPFNVGLRDPPPMIRSGQSQLAPQQFQPHPQQQYGGRDGESRYGNQQQPYAQGSYNNNNQQQQQRDGPAYAEERYQEPRGRSTNSVSSDSGARDQPPADVVAPRPPVDKAVESSSGDDRHESIARARDRRQAEEAARAEEQKEAARRKLAALEAKRVFAPGPEPPAPLPQHPSEYSSSQNRQDTASGRYDSSADAPRGTADAPRGILSRPIERDPYYNDSDDGQQAPLKTTGLEPPPVLPRRDDLQRQSNLQPLTRPTGPPRGQTSGSAANDVYEPVIDRTPRSVPTAAAIRNEDGRGGPPRVWAPVMKATGPILPSDQFPAPSADPDIPRVVLTLEEAETRPVVKGKKSLSMEWRRGRWW